AKRPGAATVGRSRLRRRTRPPFALSPDGRHLYTGGRLLSTFAIDAGDATLTSVTQLDVGATDGLAFSIDGSVLLHTDGRLKTLRSFLRQADTGALTAADTLDAFDDELTASVGEIKRVSPTDDRVYVFVRRRSDPDAIGISESLAVVRFDAAGRLTLEGTTSIAGGLDLEAPGFAVDDATGDVVYSLFEGNGVTGSATLMTPVDGGTRLEVVDSVFGGGQFGLGLPKALAFGPTGEQIYIASFDAQPLATLKVDPEPRGLGEVRPFRELYRPRDLIQIPGGPLAILPPRELLPTDVGDGGLLELGDVITVGGFEQQSVTASPDGRFLYFRPTFSERVVAYRRTDGGGLERVDSFSFIGAPLAISPDGRFFAYPDIFGKLVVATRDAVTGLVAQETATDIQVTEVRDLGFAPDGRSLFVIEEEVFPDTPTRGRLFAFDPAAVTLEEAPGSGAFAESEAAVFSPDARFLYSLARSDGGLRVLAFETSTSGYSPIASVDLTARSPVSLPRLAIDPEGLFFYAVDGGGGLYGFTRQPATGELTLVQSFEQGVDDVDWLEAPSTFDSLSLETGPGVLHVASAAESSLTTLSWGCRASETRHCFLDGRFAVDVAWEDLQGGTGVGRVVPGASGESGMFYFFDPQNWEMLVKVLNGCSFNNRFWVFTAATTNVGFTLTVTDTFTGEAMTYRNPVGTSAGAIVDTETLGGCP
ncbi:MAG: hypothetical protein AAFY88_11045, partial [Acidobacteriota bacterium]